MPETASGSIDARQSGLRVRHRLNTSKIGLTTGEVRFRAGRDVATVQLNNDESAYIPLDQLELVPERESRIEAVESRRTGGPDDLARILLAEKISGELTDVYYSMGTGKALFHPHQFRPVLKFVQSTGRG